MPNHSAFSARMVASPPTSVLQVNETTLSLLLGNNVQKIIHSKNPISFLGREIFYLNEYLYTFGGIGVRSPVIMLD